MAVEDLEGRYEDQGETEVSLEEASEGVGLRCCIGRAGGAHGLGSSVEGS